MALSSDDVVNWQLKTGMRGYLIPQVDELLDEVADELDRLHARIRDLEAEREAVKTSLDDQLEVEETLRRTLYQAQKAADQTIDDAKATAEQIVADARLEADAINAAAREKAQAAYDDAIREATEERASVRASLEAEEARMRAVRSELRNEIERLRNLEAETRRLLRGLFEDRLSELDHPSVPLPSVAGVPDVDDDVLAPPAARAPEAEPAAVEPGPVVEPEPAEPVGEDVAEPAAEQSADDEPTGAATSEPRSPEALVSEEEPEVEAPGSATDALARLDESGDKPAPAQDLATPPAAFDRGVRSADGAPPAIEVFDADAEGDLARAAAEASRAAEDVVVVGEAGEPDGGDAPYLEAVHEALDAIRANDAADSLEDDLLRPAHVEHGDSGVGEDAAPEDLFEGAPRRRRRRQG